MYEFAFVSCYNDQSNLKNAQARLNALGIEGFAVVGVHTNGPHHNTVNWTLQREVRR